MRLDINAILEKKKRNEKITVLTAYDYSYAAIVDAAEIDIILVGDSLANVVLGMESTTGISMDEMINHTKAVVKGSERGLVVGDMPYIAYQDERSSPLDNARRFIDEGGCQAVKLEWYDRALEVTAGIIKAGIPVMGHIGFTPQTADKLGGSIVQGKDLQGARALIDQAVQLEEAGCFSIVLECVPWQIAEVISQRLRIPTIGIGAGNRCDGQVLVLNDLLGLFRRFRPKFVRVYDDLFEKSVNVIKRFREDVEKGSFPSIEESFSIKDEDFEKIKDKL